jgi:hypothetical protein
MRLTVEYEIRYWDGPLEFLGTLDGEGVYCETDDVQLDNRLFRYWNVRRACLSELLKTEPDGTFWSNDVDGAV